MNGTFHWIRSLAHPEDGWQVAFVIADDLPAALTLSGNEREYPVADFEIGPEATGCPQ